MTDLIRSLAGGLFFLLLSMTPQKVLAEGMLPRVPDGYLVEKVAGPKQVLHPMMACFDESGRLYVCESAGTNRKSAELLADPQDSIKVLEDTNGDGIFDKSWTFADKLVFPQGCLWYQGALYTCSSPYLWKLEDTDGDGVCDKRTILVKSFGFSGNAADIHGPFLSPDGRFYWCDGRHGHEIRDLGGGELGGEDTALAIPPQPEPGLPNPVGKLVTKGKAARIFSCRPDGSDLRVLCGGGMDNPVEVDFWETGECLGTVNLFYGRPRGDCLVHWVEGGVYPRFDQQDSIAEFLWTGGLLGPIHNYGHVAVSGLTRYRGRQFDDVTKASTDPPSSDEKRETPDRAAFFVTQFNTHKLVKTIVERDGETFRAVETTDFLVSDNPDFHPTDVIEDSDGSLLVIDTGGWFRIGCPTSQVAKPEIAGGIYRIRKKGSRRHTSTLAAVTPRPVDAPHSDASQGQFALVRKMFPDRFSSDTKTEEIASLLEEHRGRPIVRHAVVYDLIHDRNTALAQKWLAGDSPALQRAGLIALDQMPEGNLRREQVLPLLQTNDPALLDAVFTVISHHPDWASGTVELLATWLADNLTEEQAAIVRRFISSQANDPDIQRFVSEMLQQPNQPARHRAVLVEAIGSANIDSWPQVWNASFDSLLHSSDEDLKLQAIQTIQAQRLTQFDDILQKLSREDSQPAAVRIEAFSAVAPRLNEFTPREFAFFLDQLTGDAIALTKLKIAGAFAALPQENDTLGQLVKHFHQLDASVASVLLPAFEKCTEKKTQRRIVQVLQEMQELPSVPARQLKQLLSSFDPEVQKLAAPLIQRIDARESAARARIEQFLELASGGDPNRGRYVFFGKKAACSGCHRIGADGAQIGPDLTKIGAIRQPKDLIESIVLPSSSFARGYEPFTIVTSDGLVHNGIISRETADTIILRKTDLSEVRVKRSDVDLLKESETSIMPQGLEKKLNRQELRDLLAFLSSLK